MADECNLRLVLVVFVPPTGNNSETIPLGTRSSANRRSTGIFVPQISVGYCYFAFCYFSSFFDSV